MIDRATIEKITEAATIMEVVSDFVSLKRAGANYKGLCPFHDDRSPSFIVSPAKNFCHCFACGEGGNPVTFIMKHEQLSYPDALRYLAKKYGISIQEKEQSAEDLQHKNDYESMLIVNEWALKWFRQQLTDTQEGRSIGMAYFRSRGFRDDIIEKFQLGYCPNSRTTSMADEALKAGYQAKYLCSDPDTNVGTGLCFRKEGSDQLRDRFFGRVIFPIFSISGKVVGFGGRVLDAATKGVNIKYQNSPESIVYNKRKELYGLFQARNAIRKQDCCFLVEGYTDVMAMHQNGVENVVASSGTALTDDQIRLIHRLTDNIVVIYDGDEAGIKASQRGIDLLLAQGMNVKLLLLPDGDDPDSFGHKHSAQEYQQYMLTHQVDFIKFKTNLLKKEAEGDPIATTKLVTNMVESIAVIPDEIARAVYIKETAETMQMKESLIFSAVNKKLKELQLKREKERNQRHLPTALDVPPPSNDEFVPPTVDENGEVVGTESAMPESDGLETLRTQLATTAQNRFYKKEEELARAIVRYGEVPISVEEEEGTRLLSVIEYIKTALENDEQELRTPEFRQLLQLGMEHYATEGFKAERFFLNFPDPQISDLAYRLSFTQEELSKIHLPKTSNVYQVVNGEDEARMKAEEKARLKAEEEHLNKVGEIVAHLYAEYQIEIVKEQKNKLIQQLSAPDLSLVEKTELLQQFKQIKDTERALARLCGDRVIG
ncbi:MAG: DNA primase [Bacteroidaceae bacterium]|nr:DNA primase [Bacteroidaceae bacterium]